MYSKKVRKVLQMLLIITMMFSCINSRVFTTYAKEVENLAKNAVVTGSDVENGTTFVVKNATDGSKSTRWATNHISEGKNAWLQLAYEKPITFSTIKIYWEAARAIKYSIMTSLNGADWDTVYSESNGSGSLDSITLSESKTAKYIKLVATEGHFKYGISIWEFEVYNYTIEDIIETDEAQFKPASKIKGDFELMTTTPNGAKIEWTSSDPYWININGSKATVTNPYTNKEVTLIAKISYLNKVVTKTYNVVVLTDKLVSANYDIYPKPQDMVTYDEFVDFPTNDVNIVLGEGVLDVTKARIERIFEKNGITLTADNFSKVYKDGKFNILLGINGTINDLAVDKANELNLIPEDLFKPKENKFDVHMVDLRDNLLTIVGEDNDAVYMALATVELMFEKKNDDNQLLAATISDFANMQYRGAIEGFYFKPWSKEDIMSLAEYMERYKMNTFIYGPKADPYHSEKWYELYPTGYTDNESGIFNQNDWKDITAKYAKYNISLIWAIHPCMSDKPIRVSQNGIPSTKDYMDEGIGRILNKMDSMYNLGIRNFGVFVDDINSAEALAGSENQAYMIDQVQTKLEEKYGTKEEDAINGVGPSIYVPTFYGLSFGNHSQLVKNFTPLRTINENVIITFTGADCWSPIENDSIKRMAEYVGRKPAMWWNFPVNDSSYRDCMWMGQVDTRYSISTDVKDAYGILSNPMNQFEASKVALFAMADFGWNTHNFDVYQNWYDSFYSYDVDDELTDALRVFGANGGRDTFEIIAKNKNLILKLAETKSTEEIVNLSKELLDDLYLLRTSCETILEAKSGSYNYKVKNLLNEIEPWVRKLLDLANKSIAYTEGIVSTDMSVRKSKLALGDSLTVRNYYSEITSTSVAPSKDCLGKYPQQAKGILEKIISGESVQGPNEEQFSPVSAELGPNFSTSKNGETFTVDKLYDNNIQTIFGIVHTTDLVGKYFILELPEGKIINKLKVISGNGGDDYHGPADILLSNDKVDWNKVATLTDANKTGAVGYTTHEVSFENTQEMKYVKVLFTGNCTYGWQRIREIYGYTVEGKSELEKAQEAKIAEIEEQYKNIDFSLYYNEAISIIDAIKADCVSEIKNADTIDKVNAVVFDISDVTKIPEDINKTIKFKGTVSEEEGDCTLLKSKNKENLVLSYLFDSDEDTKFLIMNTVTDANGPGLKDQSFIINIPEDKVITGLEMISGQNGTWADPFASRAEVYLSNDKVDWTKLGDINNDSIVPGTPDSRRIHKVDFGFGGSYKYMKISFPEDYDGGWQRIGEMDLIGYENLGVDVGALVKAKSDKKIALKNEFNQDDYSINSVEYAKAMVKALADIDKAKTPDEVSKAYDDNLAILKEIKKDADVNADKFKEKYKDILNNNSPQYSDKESIQNALNEYALLSKNVQDLLSNEKEVLDNALKTIEINRTAEIYRNSFKDILDKNEDELSKNDKEKVLSAISAYDSLDDTSKAKLAAEKQKLDHYLEVINNIINQADFSKLKEAIKDADTKNETDYTPKTWEPFKKALDEAKVVVGNNKATQQEVNKAENQLKEAMAKLQKTSSKIEIIKGVEQTVKQGAAAEFTSSAEYVDFVSVIVDNKVVSPKSYTVKEGSTIVTLSGDFTKGLSLGKHSFVIESKGGKAETTFTVVKNTAGSSISEDVPKTGDNFNVALQLTIMVICMGVVLVITNRRKKANI